MTDEAGVAARDRREFRGSRRQRLHGLVIAGLLAVVGVGAMLAAGPAVPDGEMIGFVNFALAGAIVVYVVVTKWNPGVAMVLDDNGVWFRDWGLPPVPWRYVANAHTAGIRLRPMVYVDLHDAESFFAQLDASAQNRSRANPHVRPTRLTVPSGALDAPLTDVVEAILAGKARAGGGGRGA